jgi:uncharacterized membrane protein (GlpM family)|tara:strand:+ start:311 stop:655 length:345 start_codon:yes stop_codon:yes gene_type:complete
MNEIYKYFLQFFLGGTLFVILYHFTKQKNTVISSIIPAFPVVFLCGYFYLLYFHGNVRKYNKNAIFTFGLDVLFMILLYLLITVFIKNIYFSLLIAFILYILSLCALVKYKVLK